MKNVIAFCLLFMCSLHSLSAQDLKSACERFQAFNTKVRDGLIEKEAAKKQFKELIKPIRKLSAEQEQYKWMWTFPLQGYNASHIGGKNGSGYVAGSYSYFDGNKHTGHPAHDIFIYDKNQDGLDDRNNKPVNVLSITSGVVIACEKTWNESSSLRGGCYVWIYDPKSDGIFYYAHNKRVLVSPGDWVTAGQVIAECGRTGLNAWKTRSPTHLHLMYLKIKDDLPVPEDLYETLKKM